MQKRLSVLFFLILFIFTALSVHLLFLSQNTVYPALNAASTQKSIALYQTRGIIYDRYYTPLNQSFELCSLSLVENEIVEQDSGLGDVVYPKPIRTNETAPHIIGYLSDGIGVSGIEAAYDSFLRSESKTAKAMIQTLGNGDILPTAPISLLLPESPTHGVALTWDAALQNALHDAMRSVKKGAAVCIDADTGEVLAICSTPTYASPAAVLNDPDTPLFNRALGAYPVGSVIKPFIAAAALEAGYSPNMGVNCTGSITVGNVTFRCHERSGHGSLNLYGALKESCNPYFIRLTQSYPADIFTDTVAHFGFGDSIRLASGIESAAGSFANRPSGAALANFSFGQGEWTATPLQVAAAYAAIANGGIYRTPTLVRGTTTDGMHLNPLPSAIPQTVLQKSTADTLQDALYKAVAESDSALAKTEAAVICGKTGTAQTGRYQNGSEQLIGWFAGWFIWEQTGQTVAFAVMAEDAVSGNASAAPVIRNLVERITKSPISFEMGP